MSDNTALWDKLVASLDFDPETGIFRHRRSIGRYAKVGGVAGSVNPNGYRYISVGGRLYLAHRLAWLYLHKDFPEHDIDHVDGNRDNNAIANLRQATRSQNLANKVTPGRDIPKGVHFMKNRGTWNAKIRNKHIGAFETMEEAAEAYRQAAISEYGEFARF